jgi:hypothetical protein
MGGIDLFGIKVISTITRGATLPRGRAAAPVAV